jgi:predicted ArsR family transcriptional regulator
MAAVDTWHRALAEPQRARILDALAAAPDGLDVGALAPLVGLHANTIRWHLGVLADAGLVTAAQGERSGPGRPPTVYRATERPATRDDYRLVATILTAALDADDDGSARAEAAGREWGRFLVQRPAPFAQLDEEASVELLVRTLDENGFAPERDDDHACVHMRHCPFRELAEQHPRIVCNLHLGLVRGALAELRAPIGVEALEPFVESDRCTARLRAA